MSNNFKYIIKYLIISYTFFDSMSEKLVLMGETILSMSERSGFSFDIAPKSWVLNLGGPIKTKNGMKYTVFKKKKGSLI